jgi:HSP20 family molecular chaperone IbpA
MSSFSLTPHSDSSFSRNDIFGNIETIFNDVFDAMISKKNNLSKGLQGYPRMDIFETKDQFFIQLACAGLDEDDIDISITESDSGLNGYGIKAKPEKYVTITGDKLLINEEAQFHLKGLTRSSFSKKIRLPENLKGDPIAKMKNGLLTLSWWFEEEDNPKVKEPKKIKVNHPCG